MGSEITTSAFSKDDFHQFREKLRKETLQLMEWFSTEKFEQHRMMCGIELEGCLVDEKFNPAPRNEEFLDRVNSPLVVAELSKYNFEINTPPHPLNRNLPQFLREQLGSVWNFCSSHAHEMGCSPLMTGILPTLENSMLTMQNMSNLKRFHALNSEILRSRSLHPIKIRIEGAKELLEVVHHDVMAEAATTSLQIHFQVPFGKAAAFYNIAQVLSAPMVALTANAPFLFGRELWDETRIPLFEQAVRTPAFVDLSGRTISRVTFGRDYVRHSLKELFLENLDGFPVLLPVNCDEECGTLGHLRLHNGTIWRWNRPIIGFGDDGTPHLRIEHRVPPAGPSIPDIIANILFFYGAMIHLQPTVPQADIPFEQARSNFYAAARSGLDATVVWSSGKPVPVSDLLMQHLIPGAILALSELGIDSAEMRYYLIDILAKRVSSGQNGASWQKKFITRYGRDFRALTQACFENQSRNIPVHEWSI